MPQFLFVVEVPPLPSNTVGSGVAPEWSAFCNAASSTLKTVKSPTQLQSNAWLLPAENSLPALSALCALASKNRLSYSAVLIPDGATIMHHETSASVCR